MMRKHHCAKYLKWILLAWSVWGAPGFCAAEWMDTGNDPVVRLSSVADAQFAWYGGPGNPQEWNLNFGASSQSRMKGNQDITAIQFDLSPWKGRRVVDAELHVCRSDTAPVFAMVASTIQGPWPEGAGAGRAARVGESCWRWRRVPADPDHPQPGGEWTFDHSDFSTAAFGNYGSLVSYGYRAEGTFDAFESDGQTWLRMKLNPDLIHALMLDASGLTVTDPRGYNGGYNPKIFTREAGEAKAPRLWIRFAEPAEASAPPAVSNIQARDGDRLGESILTFSTPEDSGPSAPFAFAVRYTPAGDSDPTAWTDVPSWRIPRPRENQRDYRVLIENLTPGATVRFEVVTRDRRGTESPARASSLTLRARDSGPRLATAAPAPTTPTATTIPSAEGVARYGVCPETDKVNPLTGARMADGYRAPARDEYRLSNPVWNAAERRIQLSACRNEVVGYQLIVERLGDALNDITVATSPLAGPRHARLDTETNGAWFRIRYVNDQDTPYPEVAIPMDAPFALRTDLPEPTHNPTGHNQSLWYDLYIPPNQPPGVYTGTVTLSARQLSEPIRLHLRLTVSAVTLPDAHRFMVDLNGYGSRWSYGDEERTRLRTFQLGHRHRMTINTLPYGWNSNINSGRAPVLSGAGETLTASDWSALERDYGPFLDGSAFRPDHPQSPYVGPGMQTPIATFYTPFHESWPVHVLDPDRGFDAAGRGGAYWNTLIDSEPDTFQTQAPDVYGAFGIGYEEGVRRLVRDWLEHAQARGWHETRFQIYLNNKSYYSNCPALWVLEECATGDDFRAVGYFHELYRQGAARAAAPDVRFCPRIDISDKWGQHYGQLDDRIQWNVMSASAAKWHWPNREYRNLNNTTAEQWLFYGTGPGPAQSGMDHARQFLAWWARGFDGGVPYWDNFQTSWNEAETLSLVYSGANIPGHGLYDGPLGSIRLKTMRQAIQIVELANRLAEQPGWNRARVTDAINERVGDGAWDRSFDGMDTEALYQLRADLVATLEGAPRPAMMTW